MRGARRRREERYEVEVAGGGGGGAVIAAIAEGQDVWFVSLLAASVGVGECEDGARAASQSRSRRAWRILTTVAFQHLIRHGEHQHDDQRTEGRAQGRDGRRCRRRCRSHGHQSRRDHHLLRLAAGGQVPVLAGPGVLRGCQRLRLRLQPARPRRAAGESRRKIRAHGRCDCGHDAHRRHRGCRRHIGPGEERQQTRLLAGDLRPGRDFLRPCRGGSHFRPCRGYPLLLGPHVFHLHSHKTPVAIFVYMIIRFRVITAASFRYINCQLYPVLLSIFPSQNDMW